MPHHPKPAGNFPPNNYMMNNVNPMIPPPYGFNPMYGMNPMPGMPPMFPMPSKFFKKDLLISK